MDIESVINWLQTDGMDILIKFVIALAIFIIGKWPP